MKHIFVVHSHITYLCALGVIEHDKLDLAHCVLVSETYYRQHPVPVVMITNLKGLRANNFSLQSYFQPAKCVDKAIKELTDDGPFTLYFSVTIKLARVLMTNPKCTAFHILEEGFSSYVAWFYLPTITTYNTNKFRPKGWMSRLREIKFPILRGYTSRLSALPIFYPAYQHPDRNFYGFSDMSYVQLAIGNRIKISFDKIMANFHFDSIVDLSNSVVWLGSCEDSSQSSAIKYFDAIEKGFINYALQINGVKRIFVRFHYRESAESKRKTLALFAKYDISVDVIDDRAIMEIELLTSRSVTLYSTYSSLLLYAAFIGHKAYSVDRFYTAGILDKQVEPFWKYVEKL